MKKKLNNPPLSKVQNWMRQVITHPKGVHSALFHGPDPLIKHLQHTIEETDQFSRGQRLGVYHYGYFSRIIDAMGENFESVKAALGSSSFEALAKGYLTKYPSTFRTLDDIGEEFSGFIKKKPLIKKFPFLSDLAKLEWTIHTSFYAKDQTPLNPTSLKNMTSGLLAHKKFNLDPSIHLLKSKWPIDEIWRKNGLVPAGLKRKKSSGFYSLVVYRSPNKQVRVFRVTPLAFKFLKDLKAGKTLPQCFKTIPSHSSSHITAWFNDWFSKGLFSTPR